ncbi:MAG: sodium:proton antiporter NhaD [Candidatus Kapabacteria bacterium]|nr:sodium:proton antiporter NhaD [Candidatus Kapabacteria bacterium]MDW8225378.1 sodium:proton antiporter NhaD [Bacteroidota bacterium]
MAPAWWLIPAFVAGYILITLERPLRLNKSAVALLTGVLCWGLLLIAYAEYQEAFLHALTAYIADIASIVFFLLCAMAIVETIRVHRGFLLLARWLSVKRSGGVFALITGMTFFLSALIDNMTSTLVMIALLRGIVPEQRQLRILLVGLVIIAANAGGAWSPIGDVTTTMLWLGGHIHTTEIVRVLFLPSLATVLVPLLVMMPFLRQEWSVPTVRFPEPEPCAGLVFTLGIGGLLFIPIFHALTGLPPVFGAFWAVGVLWVSTEALHHRHPNRDHLRLQSTLRAIDISSLLFFVGILLAVDALETGRVLPHLARWLDQLVPVKEAAISLLGILSAVVDNVPLTAACMKMYAAYPPNHWLWMLLAYAVGTGGSILVIGSAAGVVAMNAEEIDFFWYLTRIAPLALLGYGAGIVTLLALRAFGW